jgi:hypothetical protein
MDEACIAHFGKIHKRISRVFSIIKSTYDNAYFDSTCDLILQLNLKGIDFKLRVKFKKPYPAVPPEIYIESPFVYMLRKIDYNWNPAEALRDYLKEHIEPELGAIVDSIATMRASIPMPVPGEPAYLVLGASTADELNRQRRPFYTDPNFYMLAYGHGAAPAGSHPRYFYIDFKNDLELRILSFLLSNAFDEIIFDYAVMKFFKDGQNSYSTWSRSREPLERNEYIKALKDNAVPVGTTISRLYSLKNMLKDDGTLYLSGIGVPPGGVRVLGERVVEYTPILLCQGEEAGLTITEKPASESKAIKKVFEDLEDTTMIWAAKKTAVEQSFPDLYSQRCIKEARARLKGGSRRRARRNRNRRTRRN